MTTGASKSDHISEIAADRSFPIDYDKPLFNRAVSEEKGTAHSTAIEGAASESRFERDLGEDSADRKLSVLRAAQDRGRGANEFWQIPKTGWRDILIRTWMEMNADNISLLSAGVAFYSFLAFVPMLASIVLLYGIVANPVEVADHMATLMRILPHDSATIIATQLKSLTTTPVTRTTIGLIFAILLALYGAMRGATSIIGALNITYGEHEKRSLFRTTLLSLAFTVGAVFTAIAATVAIGAMSLIGTVINLPAAAAPFVTIGLWISTALVASALIAIVYRYGPDRNDARWLWLTPGSVFASVGSLGGSLLFGLYVSHFASYNATYGALGAVVSFLMWLYVTAFVVLLGAELNAEIEHQTARDTTDRPEKPQGRRGARMADTTAGLPSTYQPDTLTDLSEMQVKGEKPAGLMSPVVAGFAASRLTRLVSGVRIGTLPMALFCTGVAMLARQGRAKTAMICLTAGTALIVRAQRAAAGGAR